MTASLAPIVVFAFNRPKHLANLLDSLSQNLEFTESQLYIYVDGPRSGSDSKSVNETRDVAKHFSGVKSKNLIIRDFNLGLGQSVKIGVSEVISKHDKVIVLEDDLVVTSSFLKFMNAGLARYQFESGVASIHGYSLGFEKPLRNPYFLRGADCLGWGTWKDRWERVEWSPKELLVQIREQNLIREFNLDDSHSYFSALKAEEKRGFHSWAIYWHASMFSQNRLTLFPGVSLIEYAGADGSGTHAVGNPGFWKTEISTVSDWKFPDEVTESTEARRQLIAHYNRIFPKLSLLRRLVRKIRFEFKRRLNRI